MPVPGITQLSVTVYQPAVRPPGGWDLTSVYVGCALNRTPAGCILLGRLRGRHGYKQFKLGRRPDRRIYCQTFGGPVHCCCVRCSGPLQWAGSAAGAAAPIPWSALGGRRVFVFARRRTRAKINSTSLLHRSAFYLASLRRAASAPRRCSLSLTAPLCDAVLGGCTNAVYVYVCVYLNIMLNNALNTRRLRGGAERRSSSSAAACPLAPVLPPGAALCPAQPAHAAPPARIYPSSAPGIVPASQRTGVVARAAAPAVTTAAANAREAAAAAALKIPRGDTAGASMVIDSVTIQAGERDLVDEVSWRLMPGQRVGLVGANGAGKSTLLKALCGIRGISSGRIVVAPRLEVGYLEQTAVSGSTRTVWEEARSRMTPLLNAEAALEAAQQAADEGHPQGESEGSCYRKVLLKAH